VTVAEFHAVVVMTAVKCRLERMNADTFWFAGIPMGFLDLPDHARVHIVDCSLQRTRMLRNVGFQPRGDIAITVAFD
jgi:hypothetical protein